MAMIHTPYFPTSNETNEFITELEKIDWKIFEGLNLEEYISNTHKQITSICKLFSGIYLKPHFDTSIDFLLYRVRRSVDIKNPELRSEFSYPPVSATTNNLRANLIGNPVFYSSDHPIVALMEYIREWENPKNYQRVKYKISVWKLKLSNDLHIASFIPHSMKDVNEFYTLGEFTNEQIRNDLKIVISDDQIDGLRIMKEYFSKLFLRDDKRAISSYIGHFHIYKNPLGNVVFMYPSLKAMYGKCNYALHPNFVDEYLKLVNVYEMQVENIDHSGNGNYNCRFKFSNLFGIYERGRVHYGKISENMAHFKEIYKRDFNEEFISELDN